MNLFNATTIQRNGAAVFDAVEAGGSVKIQSKNRETMFLMTTEQLGKILNSKTQREVFRASCQEDPFNKP